MKHKAYADYETYLEVMEDLLTPIDGAGLDTETLKRLYESKHVYLENLRVKCFVALNAKDSGGFEEEDYELILSALKRTKKHIKDLIIATLSETMTKRKVSNQ